MRRPSEEGARADVLAVLGTFVLLGLAGGVLWWLLVDPARYTVAAEGAAMGEVELSKRFNADGWYAVIAIVLGFGAGLLLSWWRSRDHRLTTFLLLVGAALAAVVMRFTGGLLGPGDEESALAGASRGDLVPVELGVTAWVVYVMWPLAVLGGALMVLWSSSGAVPPTGPAAGVDANGSASDGPDQPHSA